MAITTEQIWKDLGSSLHQFILRRVGDRHVADDLLQDVFVRIHGGIHSLSNEERLAPWVYRVARNILADHGRRRREETVPFDDTVHGQDENGEDELQQELGSCVAGMIAALPPAYGEALRLVELENNTQAQAAELMGISLSGAKSRVQRGREQLREMLLECCHVECDRLGAPVHWEPRGDCSRCSCESTGS